jgi:hypothetical protein
MSERPGSYGEGEREEKETAKEAAKPSEDRVEFITR